MDLKINRPILATMFDIDRDRYDYVDIDKEVEFDEIKRLYAFLVITREKQRLRYWSEISRFPEIESKEEFARQFRAVM